jgi:hypothetical protein
MTKRIQSFLRDSFCVDGGHRAGRWLVHPDSGDIMFGSAAMRASKGLAFSLVRGSKGYLLKLRYSDWTYEIGWTNDYENAAQWVEEVNAFLATKQADVHPDEPIYVEGRDAPG